MTWYLTIIGPPMTKKNHVRIQKNKRTGKPFIMQAKQQCEWLESAVLQLRNEWKAHPLKVPVNLSAVVYRQRAWGDLLNYLAAISDALEAAGVVENDKLIVSLDGSRLEKDALRPRVEIELGAKCQGNAK